MPDDNMKLSGGKVVRASFSRTTLEIKGCFHLQCPQVVGGKGGAPEWVYKLFKAYPDINSIAISRKSSGVIYSPVK